MKKSSFFTGALCAAALSLAPVVAFAANMAPSQILANTQSYDGQAVSVSGSVNDFSTKSSRRGTVSLYRLCDSKCVDVVDLSGTTQSNGSDVTVSGTFRSTLQTPKKTFTNVVVVGQ